MNDQAKARLDMVIRYWDILPWHLKAKIVLLGEFYYLRHKVLTFLFGGCKS